MNEIVVISGKGGTGKTSLVASFAVLAERPVLADCDVDAADLHLVLQPQIERRQQFSGGKRARIVPGECSGCGTCYDLCRFDAVTRSPACEGASNRRYAIDPIACEGCGVCAWFCPEKAVELAEAVNGEWFVSHTRYGPMVHAKLGIAEENSGKLVTLVRNEAKALAQQDGHSCVIVDGSPGIGCPVIASITGADLVLIVTEPTLSGEHDLERVVQLAKHFGIPVAVCVNKYDINVSIGDRIAHRAQENGCALVGTIRYDRAVTDAQIAGAALVEHCELPVAHDVRNVWRGIQDLVK